MEAAEALLDLSNFEIEGAETDHDQESVEHLREQLDQALGEKSELETRIDVLELSEEAFLGDDDKVLFYTGLPTLFY